MDLPRWHGSHGNVVGVLLSADGLVGDEGQPIADDAFYVAFNATDQDVAFVLPGLPHGAGWVLAIDTAASPSFAATTNVPLGGGVVARGQAVVVLQRVAGDRT
jgi:glycogen operon protein